MDISFFFSTYVFAARGRKLMHAAHYEVKSYTITSDIRRTKSTSQTSVPIAV